MPGRSIYIVSCIIYLIIIGASLMYMRDHYGPMTSVSQAPQKPKNEQSDEEKLVGVSVNKDGYMDLQHQGMSVPLQYTNSEYFGMVPDSIAPEPHHSKIIFIQ